MLATAVCYSWLLKGNHYTGRGLYMNTTCFKERSIEIYPMTIPPVCVFVTNDKETISKTRNLH